MIAPSGVLGAGERTGWRHGLQAIWSSAAVREPAAKACEESPRAQSMSIRPETVLVHFLLAGQVHVLGFSTHADAARIADKR